MNTFKYTITKFDEEAKILVVTFDDGSWAEIRLSNPLPKNQAELEKVIRQFTAPLEVIQAQSSPDADLSYIAPLVGSEFEAARFSLDPIKQMEEANSTEEAMARTEASKAELAAQQAVQAELQNAKIRAFINEILDERANGNA